MPVTVDGEEALLKITRLYETGTDTLAHEFGVVVLSDGTRLTVMGTWEEQGLSYEEYLADRQQMLPVLASYRSDP